MTEADRGATAGEAGDGTALDRRRVKAFAVSLLERYSAAMATLMIDLGVRTGLLDALARAPATSTELAERAGCDERYVREWLGAMVTGGIVEHRDGTYALPPEHAACLVGDTFYDIAPMARMVVGAARHLDDLAGHVRDGGGIPAGAFDWETVEVIDRLGRARYDTFLVDAYLPHAPEAVAALERGGRFLDVGCGSGHVACLVGRRFPAATVHGVDASEEAVARARARAEELGVGNVTFAVSSATDVDGSWDVVSAFDVVHDAADPRGILRRVRDVLAPGGTFLMYDSGASSDLDGNVGQPWAAFMYGLSLSYCLTVSLAEGGEGLGNMWGRERALGLLAEAGFDDVAVHDVPGDPMNVLYVCRT